MDITHIHFSSIDEAEWLIEDFDEETWILRSATGALQARFDGFGACYTKDHSQINLILEIAGVECVLLALSISEYKRTLLARFGEPDINESYNTFLFS